MQAESKDTDSTGQLSHSCIPTGTHGERQDGVGRDLWPRPIQGPTLASAAATSCSPLPPSPLLLQPKHGESVMSQPIPRISQSTASYHTGSKCSAAAAD